MSYIKTLDRPSQVSEAVTFLYKIAADSGSKSAALFSSLMASSYLPFLRNDLPKLYKVVRCINVNSGTLYFDQFGPCLQ
jgi:hypothetical protein